MNMLRNLILSILAAAPLAGVAAELSGNDWHAVLDDRDGHIISYSHNGIDIAMRGDSLRGPTWENVDMRPDSGNRHSFTGRRNGIVYGLRYIAMPDHLAVECTMTNTNDTAFAPHAARVISGVDSEMHSYPQWNGKYFPTLLRCERDFAWGYFMSPTGHILAMGVDSPVASYSLDYRYRDELEWKWGHQIYTASWDMLHCLPLPERHPQNLDRLLPGESKKWTLHMGLAAGLQDVKPALSRWLDAPMVEAERYTMAPGESNTLTVHSARSPVRAEYTDPRGRTRTLDGRQSADGSYRMDLPVPRHTGQYRINVSDASGKHAEALLNVRDEWESYLRRARDMVAKHPPLMGNSCETFYGYYAAFTAARHFPGQGDKTLEKRFDRDINMLVDTVTGLPAANVNPERVQNFSSLTGILVDLYEATGKEHYLTVASRIGDYLAGERIQAADGSYRSGRTHYTAVIYPAKSILELADAEQARARTCADSGWKAAAEKHRASALRAIDDLAIRLDSIETEGDMTFEDGMISCSALQLALGALKTTDTGARRRYTEAARHMLERHRCLEQNLIPDARMRGATLRYWEALDVYFTPNQAMNSPHGWTAWKIYAAYYLYLLTGDIRYFNDFNDTLGACVQLMTPEGHLRWGFIPDPYIRGRVCVPAEEGGGRFRYADSIVGEQYLDMISPWMRPDDEHRLCNFGETGGAGDHTVYEIFKALEETAIATAYLRIEADGSIVAHGCKARLKADRLEVATGRHADRLHIFTAGPLKAKLRHAGTDKSLDLQPGCYIIELEDVS